MNHKSTKGVGEIARILPRVAQRVPIPGLSLTVIPTGVENVVTLIGSMPGGTRHAQENPMIAKVYEEMLVEGTKRRSKDAYHEALEARGIELSFGCDRGFLRFSLRALKEEVPFALTLLIEALSEPALSTIALAKIKKRLHGEIMQLATDTHDLAHTRFLRMLFPPLHANWALDVKEALVKLDQVSRADISRFHGRLGRGNLRVVASGDINVEVLETLLAHTMINLDEGILMPYQETAPPLASKARRASIVVPGKASTDVFLGSALTIRRNDPDYYPLSLAISVLGSGFTSRLFMNVRARDGLTYHTSANLAGLLNDAQGYWYAYASFAPELYKRGYESLLHEINNFIISGISKEELEHRKGKIVGAHLVSLSTSGGLAGTTLALLENELPLALLDEYPAQFAKLGVEEVNAVVAKHLNSHSLTFVAAGALPKEERVKRNMLK